MVAKQDLGRRSDIFEADLSRLADQIVRRSRHVALGLVGKARQGRAFRLCFDDAAEPAIDKKRVINWTKSVWNSRTATPCPAPTFISDRFSTTPAAGAQAPIDRRAGDISG